MTGWETWPSNRITAQTNTGPNNGLLSVYMVYIMRLLQHLGLTFFFHLVTEFGLGGR